MKSRFAFIGLILFLVAFSPLGEVLQVPLLFVHYSEHKQEDPSLDMGRFLEMHYQESGDADNDYQKDAQLPFKSLEYSVLLKLVFLPAGTFKAPECTQHLLHVAHIPYRERFSFTSPAPIFHPPKA